MLTALMLERCLKVLKRAADWAKDTVQRSMMLKLMPISHVPHMKEIIPTSRRTNNCGKDMFTIGLNARDSHANNSKITHS